MAERIPQEIQPLLQRYLTLTQARLPGWVSAVSLVGSIGLGDFDPCRSDVDFVTLLSRRADEQALKALAAVHREVQQGFPRWPMDGIYLYSQDLDSHGIGINGPYPSCCDGRFQAAGRRGLSPVDRWELSYHAVPLCGPAELPISVTWDEVVAYMHTNLKTYWRGFTKRPVLMAWMLKDDGVVWAVLGILRLFYGLSEGALTSKAFAGEYALPRLPGRWRPLVSEALRLRRGEPTTFPSRLSRARETWYFIRYLLFSLR